MNEQSLFVNWAVVQRIPFGLQEAQVAVFFVTGVPSDSVVEQVRSALENAGLFFGEGGVRWEGYFLSPEGEWIEGWRQEFSDPRKERATYGDLLERGETDRRITLRLSPATYAALAHAAHGRGLSLNQIMADVLDDWQERHNDVNALGSLDEILSWGETASAAYEKVAKHFGFSVTQLLKQPIFFVELVPREAQSLRGPSAAPRQAKPSPKAIVEFRDCTLGDTRLGKKAKFVGWERPVPSGRFGDAELRLALEEAVERFERGEF